jgi:hypothetical protein
MGAWQPASGLAWRAACGPPPSGLGARRRLRQAARPEPGPVWRRAAAAPAACRWPALARGGVHGVRGLPAASLGVRRRRRAQPAGGRPWLAAAAPAACVARAAVGLFGAARGPQRRMAGARRPVG